MTSGIIALAVALMTAGAGIFAMLYAAGFFNYLGGKKSSPGAVNKESLAGKLLALNDPSSPFHLVKGTDTDLVAEWKIVDASWYGIFNKSGLKEAYRALLFLDEARHSVRCYEEIGLIIWTAGMNGFTPSVRYRRSFFGGRILFRKQWGVGYGIKDAATMETGKIYEYKYDIDEIRKPVIDTVRQSGWEWVPVTARRLATYRT